MNTPLKTAFIALLLLGATMSVSRAQSDGGFKLKHRSSFTDASARNPFWPIGWVKGDTSSQTEVQETAVPITAQSFTITSISTGTNPLAVINGKTYAEGETINAVYDGQKIKIQVFAINDGDVVLLYLGKKYTVPLKRPELSIKPQGDNDALPKKDDNTLILH